MQRAIEGKQFTDVALATTQSPMYLVSSVVCRATAALAAKDSRPHMLTFPTPVDGLYRIKNGPGWVTSMKFLFTHPTVAGLQTAAGTAFIWGVHELNSQNPPQPSDNQSVTELLCDPLLSLALTAPGVAIEFDRNSKMFSGLGGGEHIGLVDLAGIVVSADYTRNSSARIRSTGVLEFDSARYPELLIQLRNGAATQGMLAMHSNY